ncbi:ParB/RepB/Spo0J family partition protein [Sphingomonas carotinifaciens]|uniref:Chromosome partitioning protein, ParB family n=1 Tax=Sphingomonas carotinifaciens TaxID=1166323 RepID=A0A1G7REG1_9SPHN|nr:ParB/RepB/Spo0J family partition protein [Sphingomonas carotinifaciens]MBB4088001.1 ParB family chromosome partitioning protein [Sphingomonas carotinifaciens]MWC45541.1 ParB/RepB/Spo0J family partition protein [Sphingomonas carotinifaciens]SDG09161.1 chromosome partitioning protein, ParB family [Sphingomonas carotinifaciens]
MTDFSGFDVFSEKAAVADADRVQLLDPELVYPDPENVRSEIDPAKIDEMAETIKERGQLQPITVAPKDAEGRYRIMYGERRWRACQKLGVQVRAIVSKTDDVEQVRIDQFIENDQREDLSTADMIRFVTGQVANGRSLAELARATGRNRTLLTRYQGLAKAPDYIAALFADISMRSAVALVQAAKADDVATRTFVANTAVEDMTVLACERFAREVGAKKSAPKPVAAPAPGSELPSSARVDGSSSTEDDEAGPATNVIRDEEADRALGQTPLRVSSASADDASAETPAPASRPASKARGGKQRVERPTIEIEGKRAMVVEALLHFEDEAEPRIVSWR